MQTTKIHSLGVTYQALYHWFSALLPFGMGNDWHRKSCHSDTWIFIRNKDEEEKKRARNEIWHEASEREQNFWKKAVPNLSKNNVLIRTTLLAFFAMMVVAALKSISHASDTQKEFFFCIVFSIIVTNHFAWKYSIFFIFHIFHRLYFICLCVWIMWMRWRERQQR